MSKSSLINVLFLGSILFIISLTMFPESSLDIGKEKGHINLMPFHTILDLLIHQPFADFMINNIGNIILFVPFGILLPLKFKNMDSLSKCCSLGLISSMIIEIVQLFMSNRWTDIDDVMLNTLGTVIGYSLFKMLNR